MREFLDKYNIQDDVLAVGVSGGADSLALALLLNECLRPVGKKVVALTVDHQLRPESADEAAYVAQVMEQKGIEHHILVWNENKPKTGIEEAARVARYRLLSAWCHQHQIHCLCVAHHLMDQAETFMIRLQRGSGLNGLCGMQEISEMYGLKILRPFLNIPPQDLKDYLCQHQIEWKTDSSNDCDDFLRVRVRKFLPKMESALGITPQRLVDTMAVLRRSRDYIQSQVCKFIKQHVRCWDNAGMSVSLSVLLQQHEEIVYRVLADLIKEIGRSDYTARAEEVERLAIAVLSEKFKGATLGHCEIFVQQGKLWIVPELKIKSRLPKKNWEQFVQENPFYAKKNLPYKLRVALVKAKMKVEF
ncbi:MAG: tRNA lysidine(34) synthetase TilS [Alphaproteobacteria bacterium]|nr:tRNA lysidine(34) synthetase TilS [Alphaproteobacteria bacterium]